MTGAELEERLDYERAVLEAVLPPDQPAMLLSTCRVRSIVEALGEAKRQSELQRGIIAGYADTVDTLMAELQQLRLGAR